MFKQIPIGILRGILANVRPQRASAILTTVCVTVAIFSASSVTAEEKPDDREYIENEALQRWYLKSMCAELERNAYTHKAMHNREKLMRYCSGQEGLPPIRFFPQILVAHIPGDAEYPVDDGLDKCDWDNDDPGGCDVFADVCLGGLNGTGWCDDDGCWCQYDPDID
ncbi:hypothetical protein [Ruegeria arenilitoris]|uniref:hypothetical protein n=1 Tax=Ruegeria arenilitoris TaxID=1173585 RepID=UPI0014806CDD|nr:hypothetical protein [Ruegeria arenilitoris]